MFGKNQENTSTDGTAYVTVIRLTDKNTKEESTLCLFGSTPKEVFLKTTTFVSYYNSKPDKKVTVVGTYNKTQLKVIAEG